MRVRKVFPVLFAVLFLSLSFTGCRTKGPIEQTGDAVESTGRAAGHVVRSTGEAVGDVVRGTGEAVEDVVH